MKIVLVPHDWLVLVSYSKINVLSSLITLIDKYKMFEIIQHLLMLKLQANSKPKGSVYYIKNVCKWSTADVESHHILCSSNLTNSSSLLCFESLMHLTEIKALASFLSGVSGKRSVSKAHVSFWKYSFCCYWKDKVLIPLLVFFRICAYYLETLV